MLTYEQSENGWYYIYEDGKYIAQVPNKDVLEQALARLKKNRGIS